MKKVLMIDYYGMCDRSGKAIGHSPKVLVEYKNLIKNEFDVSAALSPCLLEDVDEEFDKIYKLRYDIFTENGMSVRKRIMDKFKLFFNINEVLKIDGYDIYWFYRTDFFLFLFICLRKLQNRSGKMVAQVYQESFGISKLQGILSRIYRKGMLKFDGIIYTQKNMTAIHPNTLYIPDYYYDSGKYKQYEAFVKEEKAVCLGTMNPYKKLDELVNVFNRNGYPLEIRGYFYDKAFYHRLCSHKKANVVIEDRILSEDEYYAILAGAKYTVLPYDMEQYQCRTSGVLIESMFLNTVAIAPKQLLCANQIDGVGYDQIEELADEAFFTKEHSLNNGAKKKEFDIEQVGDRLKEFMVNVAVDERRTEKNDSSKYEKWYKI